MRNEVSIQLQLQPGTTKLQQVEGTRGACSASEKNIYKVQRYSKSKEQEQTYLQWITSTGAWSKQPAAPSAGSGMLPAMGRRPLSLVVSSRVQLYLEKRKTWSNLGGQVVQHRPSSETLPGVWCYICAQALVWGIGQGWWLQTHLWFCITYMPGFALYDLLGVSI